MRPFQQKIWMLTLAFYAGIVGSMVAGYEIYSGITSPWWLLLSVFVYFAVTLSLTVGFHRLFTHQAFKCSKAWHYVFALIGTVTWFGSPIQWSALHITHHRESDKGTDPHYTDWKYLFWKRYRPVKLDVFRTKRLMRSNFHQFIHNYYVLIALAFIAALYFISPLLLIFGYLVPMAALGMAGGIHQVISHRGNKPRDDHWLEWIIPLGGEWGHAQHHRKARSPDFRTAAHHLDLGYYLIKAIRRR